MSSLREVVSETARGLHGHLDKATADLSPKDAAWWIAPAKAACYVVLVTGVLVLAGAGFIQLDVLSEWRDWFTAEIH